MERDQTRAIIRSIKQRVDEFRDDIVSLVENRMAVTPAAEHEKRTSTHEQDVPDIQESDSIFVEAT